MNLNKTLLACTLLIALTACSDNYTVNDTEYASEQQAAVGWYKDNMKTIYSISSSQELLGWVVKCDNVYKNTNYFIGGVSNSVRPPRSMCKPVALLHTHPVEHSGGSYDYFSAGDLRSSKTFSMYLFTLEKCIVRVADNRFTKEGDAINPYGKKLVRLKC